MKKHMMWIILGAIILVEIIIYFVTVAPQGAVIEDNAKKLERNIKRLNSFAKMGTSIPTDKANSILKENRKKLQEEYNKVLAFYREFDKKGLKRWFPALNLTWNQDPTPAQFQSLYFDEFKKLENFCEENWITLGSKVDVDVIELESGEKITGTIVREEDDAIVLMIENGERPLQKNTIKRIGKYRSKLSQEANALIQGYKRFAKAIGPNDTEPDDMGGGFWQTKQLNPDNLRTAQMQFNIQKAIVNALAESGGTKLSYVSFYSANQPAGEPADAIEEHFDKIHVSFIVHMPYGTVSTILEKLNNSNPYINMKFVGLKIQKPKLITISTNHIPGAKAVSYLGQETNFVFPRVMEKNGGVNFGKQAVAQMNNLPDQNQIISEPPVIVEFTYNVMSMKKQPENQK